MRSCPVCGLDVEDSYSFCPDDGSRLVEADAANSPLTTDLRADVQARGTEARAAHDGVVVLYCGECAAEYPMTFVECPVHHVALTSYKIQPTPPVPVAPPASDAVVKEPNLAEHADHVDENRSTDAAPLEVQPPRYTVALAEAGEERWRSSRIETTAAFDNPKRESGYWAPSIVRAGYRFEEDAARERDSESRYENPSYRIVAATLVVALVVFCVAAVYIFFSGGARRQTVADAAQPVQTTPVEEPPPFIPTPVEALDYKQEITVASASAAAVGSSPAEKKQKYAA
ncbi:MAG TPA: hypothetical protein VLU47_16740, partial [Blastocatellia bacterium]|nr:hypothetical protein [Blastocatellia bacterium]